MAAAALQAAGVPAVAHRDEATLHWLLGELDPKHRGDPDALDFEQHPWFVERFGSSRG